jgi:hypothetical protein
MCDRMGSRPSDGQSSEEAYEVLSSSESFLIIQGGLEISSSTLSRSHLKTIKES